MRGAVVRALAAVAAAAALAACTSPAAPVDPGAPASSSPPSPSTSASESAESSASPSAADLDLYAGTAPAVAPRGTTTTRALRTDDGRGRSYRLFVPAGDLGRAPLLVALHGGLGSATQFAANSGYDGLATSNRFLVVYPDGVGRLEDGSGGARTWNGGACCGPAVSRDVDDVAFLRAVVAEVSTSYSVDPSRVYAVGHSNGGIMALRLACEASDVFVAVGVQSAALGVSPCRPPTPVSLLQVHGTADTNVPIEGGRGSGLARVDFTPPRDAAGTLAAADGCGATPTTTVDAANPDLELSAWPDCAGGSAVEFLAVEGAGHAWMGHPPSSPAAARLVGTPYPDLDASRALWSFLAAHPRR